MRSRTLWRGGGIAVSEFVCDAGPQDRPFTEMHAAHSVAFVRAGSFGCSTDGATRELVPGAALAGRPGAEYRCTHEHHARGDECLCVELSPELVDAVCGLDRWRAGALPPLPELVVRGGLLQAAADGRGDVAIEEAALLFAQAYARAGETRARPACVDRHARRRAVEVAHWIDDHAGEAVSLEDAAGRAGLSAFHFLRVFSAALGVTPHQHLLRARLRRAARLLVEEDRPVTDVALECGFADLSNFVRTFRRAAGLPPAAFRRASRGERRIVQDALGRAA
ncbi:MAG: AraC family transcriptional regulator [Burkholderiaceae bacterium]